MSMEIQIVVGGGPDSKTAEFWAKVFVLEQELELFSSKRKKKQLDTFFSKNKDLAMKKAQELAEEVTSDRAGAKILVLDESDDQDEVNNTLTVESDHRGKI